MRICVQGLWHLGSVTAACLASLGHEVVGLDDDGERVEALRDGVPPVLEPRLAETTKAGLESGNLSFSSDAAESLSDVEVLWVAFDTPVDEDDHADVEFVASRVKDSLGLLRSGTLVVVSSQMPVGSVRRLERFASEAWPGKKLVFACSPENLRLGKALEVFLNPDRLVVGVSRPRDQKAFEALFCSITDNLEWMSLEAAEMTKHAINAFLATSVTFANEVANVCELVGADAMEVARGLKSDLRIGTRAYLAPGAAFAGGTLARDVEFLNVIAGGLGLSVPVLRAIQVSNDEHKGWMTRKLELLFESLQGTRIAIWGLTYKPGTSTLRRSLAVELCRWLVARGASVVCHDPAAEPLDKDLERSIERVEEPLTSLTNAKALAVCTEWPEYREITATRMAEVAPGIQILDPNRFLEQVVDEPRLRRHSVGSPVRGGAAR